MSYGASRRPSIGSQLASWAGAVVAAVGLVWFTFSVIRPVASSAELVRFAALVLGWLVVAVTIHESGHLVAGLALGEPVRKIRIGTGATLFGLRIKGVAVQMCLLPFTGGVVYLSRIGRGSRGAYIATVAAGPLVDLIAVLYGLPVYRSGAGWLGAFVLANAIVFVGSVAPSTDSVGGQVLQSDGLQILRLLLRPPEPRKVFEGGELADDAYAVLARAGEEARLAGASEITDEDLLRALNRDPAISPLFAACGLGDRMPAGPLAESDQVSSPRFSTTLHEVLTAAIRKCRDSGISRPNAASFCLGLLLVDCAAGRLLKEVGLTEETFRKLMVAAPEEGEDEIRRKRVISADLPLEKWGTAADAALARATQFAVADGSSMVGSQHLVAALTALPESRGGLALQHLGFVLDWKKEATEAVGDPGGDTVPVLSPQAAMALAAALWRTGPSASTGTAEILLGIVDQGNGRGADLLDTAGIGPGSIGRALRQTGRETSQPAGCTSAARGMWMFRGSARVGTERWLDARADFLAAEAAATTNFQRALCHNNIAWVSLMAGDPSLFVDALERSRAALAVKPDQIAYIGTHAFALLENGSAAEAATLLESTVAKQTRPRDRASELCLLAMCRARLGRPDLATAHIAEATAADPKCPLLVRARADLEKAGDVAAISSSPWKTS